MTEPHRRSHAGSVLVAGATGFLGDAIVRAFASRGVPVRALVRDPTKVSRARAAGGAAVVGDVLDRDSLVRASRGCRAIVHVASAAARPEEGADYSRRVRVEGASNLVDAAHTNGVRRLVIGSGYWVYASRSSRITEDSPVRPRGESLHNYEAERAGLSANVPGELDVSVVRPGMVYGDGSWFRPVVQALDAGSYRLIDGGNNRWSFVSLADAGAGFRAVCEGGRAGAVYNLVDGRPARWGEFAGYVARSIGRPAPGSITLRAAARSYGTAVAHHLAANRAVSSAKLRGLGWTPRYHSFRQGVVPVLREMGLLRRGVRGRPPQ
jgi:nucleoside-diphosphate-sugar epimerase